MSDHELRGRAAELGVALTVLRRSADTGQGAVIVVSGEGGIGKTAVLHEVASQAGRLGYAVGIGRAEESDQIASMAPVLLALRSGRVPLLSQQAFAVLAPIQPQQLWLVDVVVDDLEERAGRQPLLVCVDDFQWADPSSVFALGVLPERLGGSPVVWLITTRPGSTNIDKLTRALSRALIVNHIQLKPLSDESIEQLAQDRLGDRVDEDVRHLLGGADGVPFLAVALLDGLAARLPGGRRAATGSHAATEEALPDSLVLGVRTRLESLPSQSVQLVRIGSVLGRSFTVSDAAALLGGSAAETVLPWLESAIRAGVLADDGERIVFRHDLLREAVYADAPASVRRALHRAAGQHLIGSGRSALDAAPHVLRSSSIGDLASVAILRGAATEANAASPGAGAELSQHAFSLLSATDEQWGDVGMEALISLNAAGRGAEAMAVADALLALPLGNERAAKVQVAVAHAMWMRGELDQMRSRVGPASALPELADGTRAHLLALMALAQSRDPDALGSIRAAEAAVADGERSHDSAAQATALHALGETARNAGRNEAALGFFRRMRNVAGPAYFHDEVLSLQLLDRFEESAAMLREAEELTNAAGRFSYTPELSFGLMWQAFSLGLVDDTETFARSLMRLGDELKEYSFHSEALVALCRVAQLRGDLPAAHKQLEQARGHVVEDNGQQLTLQTMQAWLSLAEGEHDDALAVVRAVVHPARSVRHRWLWQPGWLLPAVQIAVLGEDLELAREVTLLTESVHRDNPGVVTNAAVAACAAGLTSGRIDVLADAVELSRSSPRRLVRAQIVSVLGQALLKDKNPQAAIPLLDEAWELYATLGAHGEARAVQRILRGVGVRRRRWTATKQRPVSGWLSLTTSEQRVARPVAEGHTNRSAANVLVLSPNTIATHLRSVFLKLDVTSRTQLSLAVAALNE